MVCGEIELRGRQVCRQIGREREGRCGVCVCGVVCVGERGVWDYCHYH